LCHPANTGKTIADVNITFSAKVTNHHFYYRIFVYRNNFKRFFICCCANFILREITTLSFHKSVYVPGYRPLPANPACYTLIERVAAMFLSVWRPSHATEQSRDCTVPLAARTRLCQRSHIHLQSRRRWAGVAARPAVALAAAITFVTLNTNNPWRRLILPRTKCGLFQPLRPGLFLAFHQTIVRVYLLPVFYENKKITKPAF